MIAHTGYHNYIYAHLSTYPTYCKYQFYSLLSYIARCRVLCAKLHVHVQWRLMEKRNVLYVHGPASREVTLYQWPNRDCHI